MTTTTIAPARAIAQASALDHAGAVIGGRYRLERELGRGGFAVTWRATDLQTHGEVAVKLLSLRSVDHWRAVELFQREARVLQSLDHPGIPKYLDFIAPSSATSEGSDAFVLVQALAPGRSLDALIQSGWRATEAEARDIADQVLGILEYLHGRSPVVIHRDIKPGNLIRAEDGRISLIDFGSVRDRLVATSELPSVAGTFGYMAPEQLQGQVTPAVDLYALGATLVHVLSHQAPSELPYSGLALDFRGAIHVSRGFERFLARLLMPVPEERYASASKARAALHSDATSADEGHRLGNLLTDRVSAIVEPDRLTLDLTNRPHKVSLVAGIIVLVLALWAALSVGAAGQVAPGASDLEAFLAPVSSAAMAIIALFLGVVGAGLSGLGIHGAMSAHVALDTSGTTLERRVFGKKLTRRHIPRTEPAQLAGTGFLKRRLVLRTRGKVRTLARGISRDTVEGVEARVRQLERDLA